MTDYLSAYLLSPLRGKSGVQLRQAVEYHPVLLYIYTGPLIINSMCQVVLKQCQTRMHYSPSCNFR